MKGPVSRPFLRSSRCEQEAARTPDINACLGRLEALPLRQDECEATLRRQRSANQWATGVALIAALRPAYFERVAQSLAEQSVRNFDVRVYVDDSGRSDARALKRHLLQLAERILPRALLRPMDRHQGIARISLLAQEEILGNRRQKRYSQLILLEEDHLIGHTYIEAMQLLIAAAEAYPEVGPVNGNFVSTPQHGEVVITSHARESIFVRDEGCAFQLAPLSALTALSSHNVWAWGVSRLKWERMMPQFLREFERSGLRRDAYEARNKTRINAAMRRMCPDAGLSAWAGQDWLRACAFHRVGMRFKLQPTQRLMLYIGAKGMHAHYSENDFERRFKPVPIANVSLPLDGWETSLCSHVCRLDPGGMSKEVHAR